MSNIDNHSSIHNQKIISVACDLLPAAGIKLAHYSTGRHKAVCPECSASRKPSHRNIRCLVIDIRGDESCVWYCHNCGFKGPTKGDVRGLKPPTRTIRSPALEVPEWQPIVPAPERCLPPEPAQLRCDLVYEYLDLSSNLLCYMLRIEARFGRAKKILPLTYGKLGGATGWHLRRMNPPLPLYGLPLLREFPEATVFLLEGEKKTDHFNIRARSADLPWIGLSWMGGAKNVKHASLGPLEGRDVVVWGDAGLDGEAACTQMIERCKPLAKRVRWVWTADLPDGFDCGDVEEPLTKFLRGRARP